MSAGGGNRSSKNCSGGPLFEFREFPNRFDDRLSIVAQGFVKRYRQLVQTRIGPVEKSNVDSFAIRHLLPSQSLAYACKSEGETRFAASIGRP